MPPPGGGAGDMVKALQIIEWIWVNCFRESNAADRRYAQFRNDLAQLESALTDLRKVHETVHQAIEPFENDAKYIAGDFLKTIEACKEFLENKSQYNKKAGFLDNVKYGYWDHPQFEGLRGQLLFHAQTLTLMTASVGTELLVRIYQDTSELVEEKRFAGSKQSARPQNLVPVWLANVFKENFTLSPPFKFTNFGSVPLREGCLALRQHFDRLSKPDDTTLKGREQSILEYIDLLKCSWIINILRAGNDFNSRHPGEPLRRFVSNVAMEIDQRLKVRASSTEAPITDEELAATQNANSNAFLIWEVPEERKRKLAWEEKGGEEKIATICLADDEKLVIFKSSPTTLRMIVIVETEGGGISQSQHHGEVHFNLGVNQFIPLYTLSSPGNKDLTVRIYQQNVAAHVEYTLADKKAAWTLQQAITGYKVKADEKDVNLEILRPALANPIQRKERLKGRAHAWEWNPLVAAQDPPPSPVEERLVEGSAVDLSSPSSLSLPFTPISRTSTTDSLQSESKSLFTRSSTSRGRPSTLQTSRPSTSTEKMVGRPSTSASTIAPSISAGLSQPTIVIRGQPPVPPVIAFFSHSGDVYTHFQLAMNRDIFIDKLACECDSNEDSCTLMVIRRHEKKQFQIQRQSWNLSSGSSSGRRLPQASGAGLNSNAGVDNVTCTELRLTFPKPKKRQSYEERLNIIRSVYQQDDEAYEKSKIADIIRADRPVRQSTEMYILAQGLSPSSPRTNNSSSRVSLNILPRIANVSAIQLPYLDQTPATVPAPRQPGSSNTNSNPRYLAGEEEYM